MSEPKPPKPKGGARPGAGRKPNAMKAEHAALFEAAWPVDRRKKAIERLADIAESEDAELALKASEILLNRVYGKPTERKELSGPDGAAIPVGHFDHAAALTDATGGSS
jgi:hypothetical protein